MSELKLDLYYDLTCKYCNRTRSRDFYCGVSSDKEAMLKNAEEEGWTSVPEYEDWKVAGWNNMCPICTKILQTDTWKSVDDVKPPVDESKAGIESKTKKKYEVLTKDGHCVEGYIYLNRYSYTGYAAYLGGDNYLNNVTHWIPIGDQKKGNGR